MHQTYLKTMRGHENLQKYQVKVSNNQTRKIYQVEDCLQPRARVDTQIKGTSEVLQVPEVCQHHSIATNTTRRMVRDQKKEKRPARTIKDVTVSQNFREHSRKDEYRTLLCNSCKRE